MTLQERVDRKMRARRLFGALLCFALAAVMLIFGKELKESVLLGVRLSATNIIPTLFPFMVLTDYWVSVIDFREGNIFSRIFERVFNIRGEGLSAFLCGIFCGFPMGVKTAVDLYHGGVIDKDELEHLAGFINNPSLAFVISGIGVGMYGSLQIGLLLYLGVMTSSVLVGLLFSKKTQKTHTHSEIMRQKFDLVASIKSAGMSSIAISSYIIFFSALIGLVSCIVKNSIFTTLFSTLCEISSATNLIANSGNFSTLISLSITAFALGFSGFSVHLQSFVFLPPEVSRKKYLLMKFLQGIFALLATLFIVKLFL